MTEVNTSINTLSGVPMAYGNPIRVLVLHDDPVARAGLTSAFERYADLKVVGTGSDPEQTTASGPEAMSRAADVIVADYDQGSGLAAQASQRTGMAKSGCKVLIIGTSNREWEIRSALECGVRGYVLVGCALDELAAGVRSVYRGVRYFSPPVAARLAEILSGDPLTAREEEVLRLVVEGLGNKAIARRLDIAVGTVKSHLKGIFDKLGVESRTQAISTAARRGLLREESSQERRASAVEASLGVSARLSASHGRIDRSLSALSS
jgi:DNA-binding NarL/FixJ family response regulator